MTIEYYFYDLDKVYIQKIYGKNFKRHPYYKKFEC